ncbi:hypothetical protein [Actinoplanes couchii]|uniref:Abi-like protein n=1 Tax=Actinoplanes couchii TaxID=403638 RepID=A0ABQ3X1E3_9ACTN|nr:hypothetical protein [Actinoplanes couchii]MDR6316616.1 hypothetical protein [Actinoplanes couchii]GID52230.1 hypothetical protein Aco03nite_006340 [Actinoplanes couchii]
MSATFSPWMRKAFSTPRLNAYAVAAGQDAGHAQRLYWWNIEISGAFYGPLHCLEVALRNALHDVLRSKYARDDWWIVAPLQAHGVALVGEARSKCVRRRSGPPTADDIVAELSFGFWISLLSNNRGSQYDRRLWVPVLHQAFPHYHGRRRDLHENLETMRLLRNRIMHHEPIHHRDLATDHRKIYRLLGFIDPVAAKEAFVLDRVPEVLGYRRAVCDGTRPPRF